MICRMPFRSIRPIASYCGPTRYGVPEAGSSVHVLIRKLVSIALL